MNLKDYVLLSVERGGDDYRLSNISVLLRERGLMCSSVAGFTWTILIRLEVEQLNRNEK
jgi:hypothetical protein